MSAEPERPEWHKRVHESITRAELDARAEVWAPLVGDLRSLVETTILSEVDSDVVAQAHEHIRAAQALLAKEADTGSHGIHFNDDGETWHWGNAATGLKNATAPPLREVSNENGVALMEANFGAAYEGPPGCVHGGWIALALDHVSGRAAHVAGPGQTFTGTLTITYRQPTRLGPISLRAWVEPRSRNTFTVKSTLSTADGVTAEGEGVFVVARWARVPAE